MSDLPDAAHIRNLRNTGYRDGKDPTYPVCPICDQTCETIYISADNEIVGCDHCFVKACETKHNVRNCCWHIWFNDGSKVFYATDMGNLNGITAPYYDLYLVEANYRDEEIQAKIAEKKVNGEYIYEKRVLRDHMSEQDAIDWVYGNMRPDSTYVWLHCHKEESK